MQAELYYLLFGYKIDKKSTIGFGTIINCNSVIIKNSNIGILNYINIKKLHLNDSKILNFNLIKNFLILECTNLSFIGSYNKFICNNNKGVLSMNKSQFSTSNIIHVNNKFVLSNNVVFGGINSIINYGNTDKETKIHDNVYFGSSVILKSGSVLSNSLIGAGSAVNKVINEDNSLIVSHILKKINSNTKNKKKS
jgi:serine acetyltransferase